jgi:hypothetical protein
VSDQSSDYTVTVPFAPDGYADVAEAAEAAGMTMAEWVHIAALNWAIRARLAKREIETTLAEGRSFHFLGLQQTLYGTPPPSMVIEPPDDALTP